MNSERYTYKGFDIEVYFVNIGMGWGYTAKRGSIRIYGHDCGGESHALSEVKRKIDNGGPYKVYPY